jgi:alpha-galactosidase
VLPEPLACWSYPLQSADADQASCNMVTPMMCRIHQSGRLDRISLAARAQVNEGIRVYKEVLRKYISQGRPFLPARLADITNDQRSIALGMRFAEHTLLAVWRLAGAPRVELPCAAKTTKLLYPTNLGIQIRAGEARLSVDFPRTRMGCLIIIESN